MRTPGDGRRTVRFGGVPSAEDLLVGARLLVGLPRFLRNPFGVEEARAEIRHRLATRERRFVAVVRRALEPRSGNPYPRIFAAAGCELGDVEPLVRAEGVEGTLQALFRRGIYLTGDELKGRRPVRRGSTTFTVDPAGLVSPGAVVHGVSQSSGSRSARTVVPIDLAFVRDHAVNTLLTLHGHGGDSWVHAHWGAPGGTAVTNPLEFAKGGNPPAKWFSSISLAAPDLHPRYRWGAWALWLGSRLAGVPMPEAVHVPLDDPLPIARWMAEVLRSGRTPHLWTFASSAVLVARRAAAVGLDLNGARFTGGGEPTTDARRAVVRSAGAELLPRFGTTETDILGYACAQPEVPDDMHFLHDRHAVIRPGPDAAASGLPPRALLVSSLLPSAPITLLNASLGDLASLGVRGCGCPLEREGWATHVWDVRSYEKLTAGGITFLDTDVIRVLEETLPGRFGGAPTDYQLLEEEAADGAPRVTLLVHPAVGTLDPAAVADAFLEAIGGGSGGERIMELQWRDAAVLRVERRPPVATASGKILHLHVESRGRP
jgi:hypothetical protein